MWNQLIDHIYNVVIQSQYVDTNAVFKNNKMALDKYPSVTITPRSGNGVFADTSRNDRHYIFAVRCWQEVVNQSEEIGEEALRILVDDLISLFDANIYLDGNWLQGRGFAHPIPSDWRLIQAEQSAVFMAEILVDCEVIQ